MEHHPLSPCPLSPALMATNLYAGCKPEAIQVPNKSIPAKAARPLSLPAGSAHSTSSAINIPSPPLTPHQGYVDDFDLEGSHERCLSTSKLLQPDPLDRHASVLCAEPPLSMRLSTSAPSRVTTGFTFSSNLEGKAAEERDTYRHFLNAMEADYWKSVSTIRTTYFFDGIGRGGGFLAIPHIASHGNAKTNMLCRMLEAWLTRKLVEPTISDSIPVLEDDIQTSVKSIEKHLSQDPKVWAGISKSCIHIRCGHVFMLDSCCDDETIVHLGADEFYVDYPLFVDVEIKMQCDQSQDSKSPAPAEVLIAFENVVNRSKSKEPSSPYLHRVVISDFASRRKPATLSVATQ
ncbi:hypothetical protein BGW42_004361 [Actinomortierella wolfii]|nr:hypothetical protein BGW42_004361 [Actinomortierella wolfii]